MAKGTGTYDDPIICDGIFSKTIDGVKKFFKLKTASSVDTSQFVKKSGDVLTGSRFTRDVDNDYLFLNGGTQQTGASLILYGKDAGALSVKGSAELRTKSDIRLQCQDDGKLLWNNKNIVRTVDGAVADNNGNIATSIIAGDSYIIYKFTSGLMMLIQHFFNNQATGITTINFPQPFNNVPDVFGFVAHNFASGSDLGSDDSSLGNRNIMCYNRTPSSAKMYEFVNNGLNTTSSTALTLIAIGRWKELQ